jgi:CHAD domain-containing protein
MRARRVRGLDPAAPLAANARRIVSVRLDELCSFAPRALEEPEVKALHDMRIAAKRLRYVLELTSFCFGPYAAKAARRARELQDMIGAIHDCDVLEPRVRSHIDALGSADARALSEAALRDGGEPARTPRTRQAAYGALEALAIDQQARRAILFAQFRKRWGALERSGFRERLLAALQEEPTDGDEP